ncbi:MAG TPA: type II secretion system protein GspG [Bacillota bacterium]|nr:type II secretion system protein GspG [Bacillota bacterium]
MAKKQTWLNFWNDPLIILAMIILMIFVMLPIILPNDISKIPIAKSQILATENLITQYHTDTGFYPSTSDGLKSLMERPSGPPGAQWNGPYTMKPTFIDGWGYELHYQCPGTHNPDSFDLWSYGADGIEGGTGKTADIGNW